MSMERLTKDMNIIARLDDEPNDVGGLTAAQLKAKFDEGGVELKRYLNEVLLPALEAAGVEHIIRSDADGELAYLRIGDDGGIWYSADGTNWHRQYEHEVVPGQQLRFAYKENDVYLSTQLAQTRFAEEYLACIREGVTCWVEWDGALYEVTAFVPEAGSAVVAVGSEGILNDSWGIDQPPFYITGTDDGTLDMRIYTLSTEEFHTVRLYRLGAQGVSPKVELSKNGTVTTLTVTDADGVRTAVIADGAAGEKGADGADGKDGADGYTPVRGTDYWTAEDREAIVADVLADLPESGCDLPTVTAEDNGKILQVVDGAWAAVAAADSAVATYVDDYINEALGGEY